MTARDVAAGEACVEASHKKVLACRSRVGDVVEVLTTFQGESFPEVPFHMSVGCGGSWLVDLVPHACVRGCQCRCFDASWCSGQCFRPGPAPLLGPICSPHQEGWYRVVTAVAFSFVCVDRTPVTVVVELLDHALCGSPRTTRCDGCAHHVVSVMARLV